MIVAITSHGQDGLAAVDSRFNRAEYVAIYDQRRDAWSYLSNGNSLEQRLGFGTELAQVLIGRGIEALITGHIGPKAFRMLDSNNIAIYSVGEMSGSVQQALALFQFGKLARLAAPNGIDTKYKGKKV